MHRAAKAAEKLKVTWNSLTEQRIIREATKYLPVYLDKVTPNCWKLRGSNPWPKWVTAHDQKYGSHEPTRYHGTYHVTSINQRMHLQHPETEELTPQLHQLKIKNPRENRLKPRKMPLEGENQKPVADIPRNHNHEGCTWYNHVNPEQNRPTDQKSQLDIWVKLSSRVSSKNWPSEVFVDRFTCWSFGLHLSLYFSERCSLYCLLNYNTPCSINGL